MHRRITLVASLALATLIGFAPGTAGATPSGRLSAPSLTAAGPFGKAPAGPFDEATASRKLAADVAALERQLKASGISIPSVSKELQAAGLAAKRLHNSLSSSQRAQLRKTLDRNSKELAALINSHMGTRPKAPDSGKAPQNARDLAKALADLTFDLNRGVNAVLDGRQKSINKTATQARPAAAALTTTASRSASTSSLGSSCYYGAYYEQLALLYKYYGYLYAYYNYVYYGGSYAYYAYLYGYYAYYYGTYAAPLLSQAYFQYLALGYDFSGTGDDGASYAYYDYYYAYYGYLYGYYSYYYEGGQTYAYYAYYYLYYGQYYGYYAYYYGSNYCQ